MVNTEIRLIIFFAVKGGGALYSQQKQDQELTVAQILSGSDKKFKGLDLVDRMSEEVWTKFSNIVQEAVIKTIPKKKEMQKRKMVV